VQTVHYIKSETDLMDDPVMSEARVYRVGDLQELLRADKDLVVDAVAADSSQTPLAEPANVLDQDAAPDGNHAWASADAPLPHFVELTFREPYRLDRLGVVLPLWHSPRAEAVEVQGADEGAEYRTLWSGEGLSHTPVVDAQWPARRLKRLRVVVRRQVSPFVPSNVCRVEELILPGWRIVAPKPARPLPPLTLAEVRREGDELVARGTNITAATRLVLDAEPLEKTYRAVPLREPWSVICSGLLPTDQLRCVVGAAPRGLGPTEAYLTDGIRRSNTLSIRLPDRVVDANKEGPRPAVP
jgi:hypothetical protein